MALRNVKNNVIGNPSAKLQLARDPFFVTNLIDCLNYLDPRVRIEAAHVVASLSYGSDEALLSLLRANAPRAFLFAIAHFQPNDPPALLPAFTRALRALAVSIADVVGPSQHALGPQSSIAKHDAKEALDFLFHLDTLDTLLPLLALPTATSVPTSIAQLLAAAVRDRPHRRAVSEWLPPPDRPKDTATTTTTTTTNNNKARRGWEKASAAPVGPAWLARILTGLLNTRDVKLQEAALSALAALAKDNPDVAVPLSKPTTADREREPTPAPLSTVLALATSRVPDVQLAACLCATHILRATTPTPPPAHVHAPSPARLSALHTPFPGPGPAQSQGQAGDDTASRTVMHIVNRIIDSGNPQTQSQPQPQPQSQTQSLKLKTRACWVLLADDTALCQAAFDRGCLTRLLALLSSLPAPPGVLPRALRGLPGPPGDEGAGAGAGAGEGSGAEVGSKVAGKGVGFGERARAREGEEEEEEEEWEWDEPESVAALREAALTAIAAISLFDNDVRRALTESPSPPPPSSTTTTSSSTAPYPFPNTTLTTASGSPPPPSSTTTTTSTSTSTGTGSGTGTGAGTPPFLQLLLVSLVHPAPGVRYAACQCVRALSRAVAVLRTNIVDSGLGMGVWRVCVKGRSNADSKAKAKDLGSETGTGAGAGAGTEKGKGMGMGKGKGKGPGEDKRVLGAGLAAVCNLVNDFSPLRGVLLGDGLLERMREVLGYEEAALRTSALWAVKNLVCRSGGAVKRRVGAVVGWARVLRLVDDPDVGVREQALNVLRNFAENEEGVELLIDGVGAEALLDAVAVSLRAPNEDVVLQAAYLLANLANGAPKHQERILAHPQVLPALHAALTAASALPLPSPSPFPASASASAFASSSRAEARGPIVDCVAQLARVGPAQVRAAGFEGALRHVCEWGAGGLMRGGWGTDEELVDKARTALDWFGGWTNKDVSETNKFDFLGLEAFVPDSLIMASSLARLSVSRKLPLRGVRAIQTSADTTQLQGTPGEGSQPFTVKLHPDSFRSYKCDVPELEVEVSKDQLLKMYRQMQLMRRMEMASDALYKAKLIRGFCHLATGQEAVAVGLEHGIVPNDRVITAYRCHPFAVLRGGTVAGVISELLGRKTGMSHGKGGSMHIFTPTFFGGNGIVGAQVPIGAGVAFAQKYMEEKHATFALYGDGASNQGQVFEAFNMAKLWNLPAIFICENNKYGMGTSAERSSANTEYFTRGDKIPGLQVNGMDIIATLQAVRFARKWAVDEQKGPLLLEFVTYRYGGHSMSDPGTTYRTREEVQRMRSTQDPIRGLQRYIEEWGLASEQELKLLDKDAKAEVDAAVEVAKAAPEPETKDLWTDIYFKGTEPPFMRGREREEVLSV
ncbi:hypothetical protein D9615_008804 [Tricholomella constricta]|uniref:Pyruvate dehydrogenase E1 component subunit alpha n=1 Tax=Tricholomella constricta TaxID=117010 RepID=A0A8H5H8F2_9AGAR|nr:hypothetical protein D9615_008804 [Tricholomella constricta]